MLRENENVSIDLSTIHPTLKGDFERLLFLNEKLIHDHTEYDFIKSNCSTYTLDDSFTTYPLNRNRFVTFYSKGVKINSNEIILFYKFENEKDIMPELLLLEEMFRHYILDNVYLVFDNQESLLDTYKFLHSFYSNEETTSTPVNYILGCEKETFLRFFSNSLYSRT